jgi:hypothetical protein
MADAAETRQTGRVYRQYLLVNVWDTVQQIVPVKGFLAVLDTLHRTGWAH